MTNIKQDLLRQADACEGNLKFAIEELLMRNAALHIEQIENDKAQLERRVAELESVNKTLLFAAVNEMKYRAAREMCPMLRDMISRGHAVGLIHAIDTEEIVKSVMERKS